MSTSTTFGMSAGFASMVRLKMSCSTRPPSRLPGASPTRCSGTSAWTATSRADAHEVDVHEIAARRVPLDLAGEGELLVAVDLEADQGVGAALTGEEVRQLPGGDGDRDRVGVEAVHDGGNLAGAAEPPGGAGAALRARFGGEHYVGHVARTSSGGIGGYGERRDSGRSTTGLAQGERRAPRAGRRRAGPRRRDGERVASGSSRCASREAVERRP